MNTIKNHKIIVLLLIITVVAVPTIYHLNTSGKGQLPTPTPTIYEVFQLVNDQRVANHLPALSLDPKLISVANDRCADMVAQNYWAHVSPQGVTPQQVISRYIPNWHFSGENISYGYPSSAAVVNGWMGSPEHRVNILNPGYTEVGYAICQVPSHPNTVVQDFVGF